MDHLALTPNPPLDGEGNCVDPYGKREAETPEAKLKRLGRVSVESGAFPLPLQHTLNVRACANIVFVIITTIFLKKAL
jgi:hypothetical protein